MASKKVAVRGSVTATKKSAAKRTPATPREKILISYTAVELPWAEWIARTLSARGHTVTY